MTSATDEKEMIKEKFEEQFNEALRLQSEGKSDEALDLLRELEKTGIYKPAVLGMIGNILYVYKKDVKQAIDYLRETIKLSPKSEMASLGLFHALFDLHRTDEAFNEMRRFMSISDSEEYRRLLKELNTEKS